MGQQWGKLLGRGLVPLSHPENFIWDPGTQLLQNTDFSDVYHFSQFPLEEFGSPRSLAAGVMTTMDSRRELKEYALAPKDFDRNFFQGLSRELVSGQTSFANSKEVYDYLVRNRYGHQLFQKRRTFPSSYVDRVLQSSAPSATLHDYLDQALFKQSWFDRDDRTQGLGAICEKLETELKNMTGPDAEEKRRILAGLKSTFDVNGLTLDGKLRALQEIERDWKSRYPDFVRTLIEPLQNWTSDTAMMINNEEEQLKVLALVSEPEARQHVAQRREAIRQYWALLEREGVAGLLRRRLKEP